MHGSKTLKQITSDYIHQKWMHVFRPLLQTEKQTGLTWSHCTCWPFTFWPTLYITIMADWSLKKIIRLLWFWGCTSSGVYVARIYVGERQLRSLLLYLCDIFQALINSLMCRFFNHLSIHLSLQKGEDPPMCIPCNGRLTLEHALLHCLD